MSYSNHHRLRLVFELCLLSLSVLPIEFSNALSDPQIHLSHPLRQAKPLPLAVPESTAFVDPTSISRHRKPSERHRQTVWPAPGGGPTPVPILIGEPCGGKDHLGPTECAPDPHYVVECVAVPEDERAPVDEFYRPHVPHLLHPLLPRKSSPTTMRTRTKKTKLKSQKRKKSQAIGSYFALPTRRIHVDRSTAPLPPRTSSSRPFLPRQPESNATLRVRVQLSHQDVLESTASVRDVVNMVSFPGLGGLNRRVRMPLN
ncbi:hypothetical protein CC1G_05550 [Coprinopsis cinerea okayama7|uniref:Uncharacterized protein n=1 Tax=Coprinopsis cinerea (strain Okayama-7 / 130 / ATCC MYA-4618 / FGSC 9003) TaxID=240176 RepID=A8P1C8_COPC7|nr:hypothetical protein CC1G_05550 [Coprinopsis cinerea okayama7\|eukprot:XP_001838069.2 hypothetical protein CC1G_05550 [Coprinopsis cinerea okayama7\